MEVSRVLETVKSSIRDAEEYSYFLTHSVRYFWVLEKICEIAKGRRLTILDIGCFPYHIGLALELLGHQVYGIASYHEPIKKKNVFIVDIENEEFPFKINFFDMVLMSEVIEHLSQSPIFSIKEAKRVLKKDGKMIVTTPNIARSINRIKLLLGKTIMFPVDVYFENEGKGNVIYHRHNREYTKEELLGLFKKIGWNTIEGGSFISYTPYRKRVIPDPLVLKIVKYINYFFMYIIPSFQDSLFIIAKK